MADVEYRKGGKDQKDLASIGDRTGIMEEEKEEKEELKRNAFSPNSLSGVPESGNESNTISIKYPDLMDLNAVIELNKASVTSNDDDSAIHLRPTKSIVKVACG